MADYLKFFNRKKDVPDEDQEAYEEQLRAFNRAKEILKKQEMDKTHKLTEEISKHGGITVTSGITLDLLHSFNYECYSKRI